MSIPARLPSIRLALLALLISLVALVQGCVQVSTGEASLKPAKASLRACCTNMEEYPRWYVDMARTVAPALGTLASHVSWRSGHLKSKRAAQDAVLSVLKPLDIVLVSSKGKTSGRVIPGLFGHAAVYLGTEAELRDLGVWNSPKVQPYAATISKGRVFIEADSAGVHLSPPSVVLNTDAVAILRPHFSSQAQRRKTVVAFIETIGMDFDFLFNVDTPECTFCTELIHRVMPQLDLPIMEIYGVRTIMPDSLAAAAIRKSNNLRLVGYVKANRNGWNQGSMRELADDIGRTWAKRQP